MSDVLKSCLTCKYMDLDTSQGGGGCDTCGYGGEGHCTFECRLGIWKSDLLNYISQSEFNTQISIALRCQLYEGAKDN